MTAELLKMRPLCGSDAEIFNTREFVGASIIYRVRCVNHCCHIEIAGRKNEPEAIAAWNRRAGALPAPDGRPLTEAERSTLAAFRKHMDEKAIPDIVAIMRNRDDAGRVSEQAVQTMICAKCGADRFKEDCKGNDRANCPMYGTAQAEQKRLEI